MKLKLTTLPRSRGVSIEPIAPVATSAQAVVTTGAWARRPDLTPERGRRGGDGHPGESSLPGSVGLPRAHPLTKTEAMRPSRRAWSSYWGVGPKHMYRYKVWALFWPLAVGEENCFGPCFPIDKYCCRSFVFGHVFYTGIIKIAASVFLIISVISLHVVPSDY